MIKANELRVNNWVVNGNGKPLRVTGDCMKIADIDEEFFSPIPLTPVILAKCGFKKKYTGWQKFPITFRQKENGFGFIINGSEVELKNLHQLQNLYFALTGDELEVNL